VRRRGGLCGVDHGVRRAVDTMGSIYYWALSIIGSPKRHPIDRGSTRKRVEYPFESVIVRELLVQSGLMRMMS
jgi:hypothetical protein